MDDVDVDVNADVVDVNVDGTVNAEAATLAGLPACTFRLSLRWPSVSQFALSVSLFS
eukprot:CAMPEP_0203652322 /NCGR_PEP_ID=MMETSP0088-20131115/29880_1 /ASSEMBLY_ACC=CAM_ASM_001087 /TAXON_ID=426623 /ORGANISM="Chaetoceros affinis, Strain CCMP159" /LENGTH=56 /DNA_ID=CAMNT_0050511821 /DNA_START=420 /DNA_END=586 /DNA_ORIENTATION=+